MSEALKEIETATRAILDKLLKQCSLNERQFFNRLYPSGVPEKSLHSAILLRERTIAKNKGERFGGREDARYDPPEAKEEE